MTTEKLSWTGDTIIIHYNLIYAVDMDCSVEYQTWQQPHGEGYTERCGEAVVCLDTFEAEIGGKPVYDRTLLRELRLLVVEWINENREMIIRKAK